MQLMEAAASGLPLSGTDRVTSNSNSVGDSDYATTTTNNNTNTIATSTQRSPSDLLDVHDNGNGININNLHNLPPTISDIEQTFTIDDDDDEFEGPPSIFSNSHTHTSNNSTTLSSPPTNANAHLWKSNAEIKMDEEKLGFITGSNDTTNHNRSGGYGREHDESRDLLLLASRRLAQQGGNTPPRSNGSGRMNMSSLNIDSGNSDAAYGHDDDDDDFRNRRSSYGITLPNCCILHRRTICATLMIVTLVIVLLAVVEPARRQNTNNNSGGGVSAPWADTNVNVDPQQPPPPLTVIMDQSSKPMDTTADIAKFNRIKDRILEHGISHASTLEETYTPQYKALTWLVRDDERQLDLPLIDDQAIGMSGSDVDTERTLFQRYALAVIWYQTTNLEIVKESMTGSQVENPFENKNDIDPLTFTQKDITWNRNTNWLSNKGLCSWHGITCHPHDDITGNNDNDTSDDDWYVSILNLTDNNINGIVPREVYTGFNKLKALDLSRNGLKGTLMKELGEMKDLEDLFLFENNFSG